MKGGFEFNSYGCMTNAMLSVGSRKNFTKSDDSTFKV